MSGNSTSSSVHDVTGKERNAARKITLTASSILFLFMMMLMIWNNGDRYHDDDTTYSTRKLSLLEQFIDPKSTGLRNGPVTFYNPTSGKTFKLPNRFDYMNNNGHTNKNGLQQSYIRDTEEIKARGEEGNCVSTLHVIDWLMKKVNERSSVLMLAYGGLIHYHREKDFINSETGEYIDDDFDFWTSLETLSLLNELEPELFEQFGFTMRFFVNSDGYTLFGQILAACGLNLSAAKVKSDQPGIDLYPLIVKDDDTIVDIWQGNEFQSRFMYPPKHVLFESTSPDKTGGLKSVLLNLQLPPNEFDIMTCLYGDWTVPSEAHASEILSC